MPLGPWELGIILVIVLAVFGAGKLSQIGGALGKGVKEFRLATRDESATSPSKGDS
jgi:sec-independent protein translocase protein TatA